MRARYFAYGSNLTQARLAERVRGVRSLGIAWLPDHRLAWDKRGADGSGKANLRRDPAARVWGVVYAVEAARLPDLDAHEPHYERFEVEVRMGDAIVSAQTYLSERRTSDPPHAWYKRLVIDGARAHGLPADWIAALEACPVSGR